MDTVRWKRISAVLAKAGHQVDIILNAERGIHDIEHNLRYVSVGDISWSDYDVVKTEFHLGFDFLEASGGADHPFIISKLGSVVGLSDDTEGVYFTGDLRVSLERTQQKIHEKSRYISLLTQESQQLWVSQYGADCNLLHVPTGVDEAVPEGVNSPYKELSRPIVLYVGNLYSQKSQPEINILWQTRLNSIGKILHSLGMQLVVVGPGNVSLLDPEVVDYRGAIPNELVHEYIQNADVGIVLAQGVNQHNESSKLYELLRFGLPVVCEASVPNCGLINETGLGFICRYDDDQAFAAAVLEAYKKKWDRESAIASMIANHSWRMRIQPYLDLLDSSFSK